MHDSDSDNDNDVQCLDTRIVYENKWMTVREDTVRRASGATGVHGDLFLAHGYSNQGYHVFAAFDFVETPAPAPRDAEEEDLVVRRFTIGEVGAMIDAGEIKDATTVAVLGLMRCKGLL